jgi:hypothetical protein
MIGKWFILGLPRNKMQKQSAGLAAIIHCSLAKHITTVTINLTCTEGVNALLPGLRK